MKADRPPVASFGSSELILGLFNRRKVNLLVRSFVVIQRTGRGLTGSMEDLS